MANSSIEELLQAADSASRLAQNTWITYILFGAYLSVAVGATTPEQLLLEAPITLPLMGVTRATGVCGPRYQRAQLPTLLSDKRERTTGGVRRGHQRLM